MSKSQFVQIERQDKFAETDFHQLLTALNQIKLQNLREPQIPIENLSAKVANNVVTASGDPVPDCMTCGACCAFPLCVTVKPTDKTSESHFWKILGSEQKGEIVVDQFMRRSPETTACTALGGKLGETVGCQIYEERPQVCREFEAGSDKCRALRRAYGIELPLDEKRALEATFRLALLKSNVIAAEKILYAEIISHPETEELIIVAILEDSSRKAIHLYKPQEESWLQAEFAGLTILDAHRLIQTRSATHENEKSD